MSDAFQKIKKLKLQLQKTIREEGGKILQEELKKTLDLMPEVEAIVWTQHDNVYNDESYAFHSSGFAVIPVNDCPWRDAYIKELSEVFDDEMDEKILNKPQVYAEATYCLGEVAEALPEHAERIHFIKKILMELSRNVPQEVLETFANGAARVTRVGITFEEYDYD